MQYKTIVLEILQQRTELYEQLQTKRTLLAMVDRVAIELKIRHNEYMEQMAKLHPEMEANIAYSAAFELALKELEDRLLPESEVDEPEELSLDGAMAFIRKHSPKK